MGVWDVFLQSSSSSSVTLLGTLLALAVVYFVTNSDFRRKKATEKEEKGGREPPGPKPLPLLGNILQIDLNRPYNTLMELSKTYGPVFTVYFGLKKLSKTYGSVFTVYFGLKKVVVLAGYRTVKAALVNHAEEFGDRDAQRISQEFSKGNGVLWNNGDSWKEMRRFALSNLRDFGMGKKASEEKIIEECEYLVQVFKDFKGEAFDTTHSMNCAVSNIICSIVYGSRFEYEDQEFKRLVDQTNRAIQLVGSPSVQLYNLFPWVGKLLSDVREVFTLSKENKEQNLRLFSRLKQSLNPQNCRSFVDAFLLRKQSLKDSGITNSHYHNENLLMTVMNLFAAGTDTTATTLRWGLFLMAKYPNIQAQVRAEVVMVIGDRQVRTEDRRNLPFTDAVIHETQRLASIVPMALPHKTSQDVNFQGHFIKKGTTVYPLLTSVLYDETEWEKPNSFYPAHFLDKDGKFMKRDAFMPFSAGRRVCLGEGLAKVELFVFFTTLLQKFLFTPAPGVTGDDLDLTPRVGFILNPSPHKLCAIPYM